MLKLLWAAVAGAVASLFVLIGLYLPGAPTEPVFMVPFFLALATFLPVFYKITGRLVGQMPMAEALELLRELPVRARIGLGIMFAATMAQMVLNKTGADELGFKRIFAAIAVWLCTGSAAMAYAHHLRLNRATPLEPVIVGWRKTLAYVIFTVVGLAIAAVMFLSQRPT